MDAPQWHHARRVGLLREHPEVRALQGPSSWSAVCIALVAALQLGAAVALRDASTPVLLLCAVFFGAVASHAAGVLIHECAHNLVAKGKGWNKFWSIVANTPLVIPGALDFRRHHLAHHAHLGEDGGRDTQAPSARDVKRVGHASARKALWLTIGPLFAQAEHTAEQRKWDRWDVLNAAWQLVAMGLLFAFAGLRPLVYLVVSSVLAFSLHPVGIRRIGEHLTVRPGQPTNSYYGAMNWLSFNVGYHVEHHDLPAVPWHRLPRLRAAAPEVYDGLYHLSSWTKLLWNFVFDDAIGVEHYIGMGPALQEQGACPPDAVVAVATVRPERAARVPRDPREGRPAAQHEAR